MGRLGLTHDEADDFEHPALPIGHPMRHHVLYRLRREDWRAVPAQRRASVLRAGRRSPAPRRGTAMPRASSAGRQEPVTSGSAPRTRGRP